LAGQDADLSKKASTAAHFRPRCKTESWELLQAVRDSATYTITMTTMSLPMPKAHLRACMAGNLKKGRNKGRHPEAQGWAQ